MSASLNSQQADRLDAQDLLRAMRSAFHIPPGTIYLDGNSLGAMPKAAAAAIATAVHEEWANGLIRSWNSAGWFTQPGRLGDRVGKLIGAAPGETVVADSTSINIYKALHAGLSLRPGRNVIVAESGGFPTDIYIAEGVKSVRPDVQIRLEGVDAPSIEDLLDERVAAVLVNHVDYRTGILRDMTALTKRIQACGAVVIWDLCHSAGALDVDLGGASADMAVGCTYKYLNGGPGSPAYVMVAKRHHGAFSQPLTGWWAHARQFSFEPRFAPGPGMAPMLCGTHPVLAFRALEGALDVWDDVDLTALRAKSLALTDLFIGLVEEHCGRYGVTLAAPREHQRRGSQVSFRHDKGYEITQALIARGVIGDFRTPDYMRFGFAPLYLSYRDVFDAAMILHDILKNETWREPQYAVRASVT